MVPGRGLHRGGHADLHPGPEPGEDTAHIKLTFQTGTGEVEGPEVDLAGGRRTTFLANHYVPNNTDVSTKVESDKPVICERAMYGAGWSWAHVGLGYAERAPELSPQTEVLTADSREKIASISPDYSSITFSGKNSQIEGIEEGDIISSRSCEKAPRGFLLRVTSVSRSGNQTTLQTEPASLEEALRRGSFSCEVDLSPEMASASASSEEDFLPAAQLSKEFPIELGKLVLFDLDGDKETENDQIRLEGSGKLTSSFHLDGNIDYDPLRFWEPPELKSLTFTHTASLSAELKLVGELSYSLKKEVKVRRYNLGVIHIQAGPVPVEIFPILTIKAGADLTLSASAETGISQTLSQTTGLRYAGGLWEPISSFRSEFTYTPPTLSASAEARAWIRPELSLMVYNLAGPYASLTGYLELSADPAADPWWALCAGLDATVGVKVEVFSKPLADKKKDFRLIRKVLAQAEPKPVQKWQRTFGGASDEWAESVQQTKDGGYILAGYTGSFGAGGYDAYLIKTDASGNLLWQRTFGGTGDDCAYSVQQTSDGGYILAGYTRSFGAGGYDAYLVKTDASGNLQWQKTYKGVDNTFAYSVQQTTDGGFILVGGYNVSSDVRTDIYLVKVDTFGNLQWQRTIEGDDYGPGVNNETHSVQQNCLWSHKTAPFLVI